MQPTVLTLHFRGLERVTVFSSTLLVVLLRLPPLWDSLTFAFSFCERKKCDETNTICSVGELGVLFPEYQLQMLDSAALALNIGPWLCGLIVTSDHFACILGFMEVPVCFVKEKSLYWHLGCSPPLLLFSESTMSLEFLS